MVKKRKSFEEISADAKTVLKQKAIKGDRIKFESIISKAVAKKTKKG